MKLGCNMCYGCVEYDVYPNVVLVAFVSASEKPKTMFFALVLDQIADNVLLSSGDYEMPIKA